MPLGTLKVQSHQAAIKAFASAAEKTIAIVPNTAWVDEISRRLIEKTGILLGKRVFTIREYIKDRHPELVPTISRSFQRFLVRKSIASAKMSYFKAISQGIVATILDAIIKLRSNGISSGQLEDILRTRGGAKEADLLAVYKAYEHELAGRGWHDEQSFPKKASETPAYIIGFEQLTPGLEALFPNATFFESHPAESDKLEVFAFNSSLDESQFIINKIAEAINSGLPADKIALYLNRGDPFAWKIAAGTHALPYNIMTSKDIIGIFNDPDIPSAAPIESFIEFVQVQKRGQAPFSEKNSLSPFLVSRRLAYMAGIDQALARLSFEWTNTGCENNISSSEFLSLFHQELDAESAWPEDVPCRIITWENAGLYDTKLSILPRMNDGNFPKPPSHLRFFTEPDTLKPRADDRIERIFLQNETTIQNSIRQMQHACSKKTIATFHMNDASGREASPSPFIIKYPHIQPDFSPRTLPDATLSCGTNFKTPLNLKNHTFSATRLEEFGRCPFAYFCRHILGIEPPEDETPEIMAKDKGTIMHEVLEKIFTEALDDKSKWKNIIDDIFSRSSGMLAKYHPDMVKDYKRRAIIQVEAVLAGELEYLKDIPQRPAYFELKFDDELAKGIPVTGRIDRIDTDDETFSVLDYKTGSSIDSVINGIKNGTELQIPIYTEMARRIVKKEPVGAYLYSTKERKRKTGMICKEMRDHTIPKQKMTRIAVPREEFNRLIELGIKTAISYVEKIRNGEFESAPHKCDEFCDWKDVCRYSA